MDFFEAVQKRRSIRKFTDEPIPDSVVTKALEAAVLAPNSSNVQTWDFYWVSSPEKKKKLVEFCLNQSAARTAQHLIVIVADPGRYHRSRKPLLDWAKSAKAPKPVVFYYEKFLPYWSYRWGFLNSIGLLKWLVSHVVFLFRPIMIRQNFLSDMQEVAIKSAALAAENFVLALTSQGCASCMMEGFDEGRVRRLLRLKGTARVVMVVGLGKAHERGTWGPQFRLPTHEVVHKI